MSTKYRTNDETNQKDDKDGSNYSDNNFGHLRLAHDDSVGLVCFAMHIDNNTFVARSI